MCVCSSVLTKLIAVCFVYISYMVWCTWWQCPEWTHFEKTRGITLKNNSTLFLASTIKVTDHASRSLMCSTLGLCSSFALLLCTCVNKFPTWWCTHIHFVCSLFLALSSLLCLSILLAQTNTVHWDNRNLATLCFSFSPLYLPDVDYHSFLHYSLSLSPPLDNDLLTATANDCMYASSLYTVLYSFHFYANAHPSLFFSDFSF